MTGPFGSRKAGSRTRPDLEIAAAVARERILDTHVEQIAGLIEIGRGQLAPWRAIEIYARLHHLDPDESRIVGSRVLARLGREASEQGWKTPATGAEQGAASPTSLFGQIRHRLRGRVNLQLRRWVELHTGRAEVALLHVHVDNAQLFVEILEYESSIASAVEVYTETVGVRRSVAEAIYFFVLDRLAADPASFSGDTLPLGPTPAPPAEEHSLRILKDRRRRART